MARVYGDLSDFGLQALSRPTVLFTPTGPGVKAGKLLSTTPVPAIVASSGAFMVDLEPTDGVVPEVFYTVSIEHLQPGGQFTHFDLVGLQFHVSVAGGRIGELPGVPLSPYFVLVSLDPPPPGYKGWYLNAGVGSPDNPAESGTGILEMVS